MTQEEKANAYDEAIKRAKEWEGNPAAVEYIFPELAESGDERIRKELVDFIKRWKEKANDFTSARVLWTSDEEKCDKYLAWLEKQGEQKTVEEINGEDYGIDSLWHAERILEGTLGEVEGYQSDDGILEHKAAITAVKKLKEQKPVEWSKKDETILCELIRRMEKLDHYWNRPTDEILIDWLKSLKERMEGQNYVPTTSK